MVFPAHDDAVLGVAEHAATIGAIVVGSPLETCRVTRSKRATYRALAGAVPVPLVYDEPAEIADFPVFVKPDRGQGSVGARVARDRAELDWALADGSDLVMEMLPGDEHTVRLLQLSGPGAVVRPRAAPRRYAGGDQRVRRAGGRTRARGSRASHRRRAADARGVVLPDRRDSRGEHRLLEVAPRVAGTMALHRALGVNLPLLSIYEVLRLPVSVEPSGVSAWIDRASSTATATTCSTRRSMWTSTTRSWSAAGLTRGSWRSSTSPSTRDAGSFSSRAFRATFTRCTLRRYRLAGLFDAVVRVEAGEEKADHIGEPDAILIDDSYRERRIASQRLGIATFDVDAVELLRDDRV